MANDSKERNQFEAASAAVASQQRTYQAQRFRLEADSAKLLFKLRAGAVRYVEGLQFDAFQLGLAMTVRDALNAAYEAGRSEGVNLAIKPGAGQ